MLLSPVLCMLALPPPPVLLPPLAVVLTRGCMEWNDQPECDCGRGGMWCCWCDEDEMGWEGCEDSATSCRWEDEPSSGGSCCCCRAES